MNDSNHGCGVIIFVGPSEELCWQRTSKRTIEQSIYTQQWRPTARQKRLYLHHQGEFQHQNCTVGTVHDSDHDGIVSISVRHSYCIIRGTTALLVAAIANGCNSLVAQTSYCNSFQLTHMPRGNHAESIASNGGQREDRELLQCSQLRQHGEFWHVSVSE